MEGEVNIHYRSPVRREEKDHVPEDELRKRQEDQVRIFIILKTFFKTIYFSQVHTMPMHIKL
jgi:hypothetical protein